MERLIMLIDPPRPDGVPRIIRCALNPEDITLRRDAGLAARPAPIFAPAPAPAFAGTGRTMLTLRLLFEAPTGAPARDVRALTAPLHLLAARAPGRGDRPCPVDLIWGRHWSFRGAVSRLSETLDLFSPDGVAARSWLQAEFVSLDAMAEARA